MEKNKDTDSVLLLATISLSFLLLVGIIRITIITKQSEKLSDMAESLQEEVWAHEDEAYDYQDEIKELEDEIDYLVSENNELLNQLEEIGPDFEFFQEYAACVNENRSYYHHPSCDNFNNEYFFIYNIDLAESYGYAPCPVCW